MNSTQLLGNDLFLFLLKGGGGVSQCNFVYVIIFVQ